MLKLLRDQSWRNISRQSGHVHDAAGRPLTCPDMAVPRRRQISHRDTIWLVGAKGNAGSMCAECRTLKHLLSKLRTAPATNMGNRHPWWLNGASQKLTLQWKQLLDSTLIHRPWGGHMGGAFTQLWEWKWEPLSSTLMPSTSVPRRSPSGCRRKVPTEFLTPLKEYTQSHQ